MSGIRQDLQIIAQWIKPGTKVLDLGCGDGSLLEYLKNHKNVIPYGVEISIKGIIKCLKKGVPVFQGDIDEGLKDYKNNSFDYVILSQTLQVIRKPKLVLKEMLRVGKKCIISFPNFGYISVRCSLLFKGKMPVVDFLPYEWYETPNIHLLTIKDFLIFCQKEKIKILKKVYLSRINHKPVEIKFMPNLFAQYGIFLITK